MAKSLHIASGGPVIPVAGSVGLSAAGYPEQYNTKPLHLSGYISANLSATVPPALVATINVLSMPSLSSSSTKASTCISTVASSGMSVPGYPNLDGAIIL